MKQKLVHENAPKVYAYTENPYSMHILINIWLANLDQKVPRKDQYLSQ